MWTINICQLDWTFSHMFKQQLEPGKLERNNQTQLLFLYTGAMPLAVNWTHHKQFSSRYTSDRHSSDWKSTEKSPWKGQNHLRRVNITNYHPCILVWSRKMKQDINYPFWVHIKEPINNTSTDLKRLESLEKCQKSNTLQFTIASTLTSTELPAKENLENLLFQLFKLYTTIWD